MLKSLAGIPVLRKGVMKPNHSFPSFTNFVPNSFGPLLYNLQTRIDVEGEH
jgi:hypothetical protein